MSTTSTSLVDRLRADRQLFEMRKAMAFADKWELDAKFNIVAARLRAQYLGFCPFTPEVDYPIAAVQRMGTDVLVYCINNCEILYVLPRAYGEMVSDEDIFKINTGRMRFILVRTRKG